MTNEKLVEHLIERHVQFDRYPGLFIGEEDATFLFYNLSGQIIGYQRYNPLGDKKGRNLENGKYYNYQTHINDVRTTAMLGVWGLETYDYRYDLLFLVEGVFDAVRLHNLELPAIACLTNNPKHLRNWLLCLDRKIIAVCEDDKAGKKLANSADGAIMLSNGKDLGELTDDEVEEKVHDYL